MIELRKTSRGDYRIHFGRIVGYLGEPFSGGAAWAKIEGDEIVLRSYSMVVGQERKNPIFARIKLSERDKVPSLLEQEARKIVDELKKVTGMIVRDLTRQDPILSDRQLQRIEDYWAEQFAESSTWLKERRKPCSYFTLSEKWSYPEKPNIPKGPITKMFLGETDKD